MNKVIDSFFLFSMIKKMYWFWFGTWFWLNKNNNKTGNDSDLALFPPLTANIAGMPTCYER